MWRKPARFNLRCVNMRRRAGGGPLAEISAWATGISPSLPARLLEHNEDFKRKQGMS